MAGRDTVLGAGPSWTTTALPSPFTPVTILRMFTAMAASPLAFVVVDPALRPQGPRARMVSSSLSRTPLTGSATPLAAMRALSGSAASQWCWPNS